jgi:hypothetical protein
MRLLAESRPNKPLSIKAGLKAGTVSRADFYREEFLKHKRCLEAQREYYSEQAITQVDAALTETIAKLDHICRRCDCDHVVSCLLRQFDLVTGLSNWSDPKKHN